MDGGVAEVDVTAALVAEVADCCCCGDSSADGECLLGDFLRFREADAVVDRVEAAEVDGPDSTVDRSDPIGVAPASEAAWVAA